jgi:hypothetical protein
MLNSAPDALVKHTKKENKKIKLMLERSLFTSSIYYLHKFQTNISILIWLTSAPAGALFSIFHIRIALNKFNYLKNSYVIILYNYKIPT